MSFDVEGVSLRASRGAQCEFPADPRRCAAYLRIVGLAARGLWDKVVKARGWLITGLIGVATAVTAAWIEGGIRFLSDLRLGLCGTLFWLDREFCCGYRAVEGRFFEGPRGCSAAAVVHMQTVGERSSWSSWSALIGVGGIATDYACFVALSTFMAWFAAVLCVNLSAQAKGPGIAQVKSTLQGFPVPHLLSPLTFFVKCVGLALAVASGLGIGKEGPIIHIAGCCAACCAALLGGTAKKQQQQQQPRQQRQTWLIASSAAGISVAFGAPLGGVLYALEEIAAAFPLHTLWKSFFCAVVGALTIRWLDTGGTGSLTLFRLDAAAGSWQWVELLPFAAIGLLGGLLGTLLISAHEWWIRRKPRHSGRQALAEVAAVAAATALVSFPAPTLRVSSGVLLEQLFARCHPRKGLVDLFGLCDSNANSWSDYSLRPRVFVTLLLTAVVRFALFAVSFGLPLPAGSFVPALTIGALVGRLLGAAFLWLDYGLSLVNCHKCVHPGVYAVVGAAATLAGTTRTTISIVVIMFELTGGLSYVVPFMVAVMIAKWLAEALYAPSITEACMARLRLPQLQLDREEALKLQGLKVEDVMATKVVVVVAEGNSPEVLEEKLAKHRDYAAFPVIDNKQQRMFLGMVPRGVLESAIAAARSRRWSTEESFISFAGNNPERVDFSEFVDATSLVLSPCTSLPTAVQLFLRMDLCRVCAVQSRGQLRGLLTREQLGRFVALFKGNR